MTKAPAPTAPPHCPNPACRFHRGDKALWRFVRNGFYFRKTAPYRVQRYRCDTCRRRFADQTFLPTYWMHRGELFEPVFHRLLGCSGFRQIAREFKVSPQTIARVSGRLGRHCLLFHELRRPKGLLSEPLALDSFVSFEYSQYHPTSYHVAVGQQSHFFHGFTVSEHRRSGRMTAAQKKRRAALDSALGKPNPRAVAGDVAALLATVAHLPQAIELWTDEHQAYPVAVRRLSHLAVTHRTISSRAARTPQNPLFPVNLLDLWIRHNGANHKRETIAFSKRRASAADRMAILMVWRNWMKEFSERHGGGSPAMRLGLTDRLLEVGELLRTRLFPTRIPIPEAWKAYYWRTLKTRAIPNCKQHALKYAA